MSEHKYKEAYIKGIEKGKELALMDIAYNDEEIYKKEFMKLAFEQGFRHAIEMFSQGLDEAVRCAMCTNVMANDRGCDGGCVVNEGMYKSVMSAIGKQFSAVTDNEYVYKWSNYEKTIGD